MPKDRQVKYENQLPKLEKWTFDRLFGYTAGLASICGLIGAPFIVQNQDVLSYLYMGFLSLLVLILLLHAILVEKRKLHRYAQTVFYTHYAQHIIRDSLAEMEAAKNDEVEKTVEKVLDAIANCFSITSGKMCRASLIELDSNFELKVVARDSMSMIRTTPRTQKHLLSDNTDFKNLWYAINGYSRYYLNNNIPRVWLSHDYFNSSFLEVGNPETLNIAGYTLVRKWPLSYKSALVLPIRYVSDFNPPKGEEVLVPHWNYYGFLCIDCISKNSFDQRYSPELGAAFADMLYIYLNQSNCILDVITEPNTHR